ncbi:hypothetical protein ACWGNU_08960 [Paenibacillus lautus]
MKNHEQFANSTALNEQIIKQSSKPQTELYKVFEHYAPPAPLKGDWRVILSQINGPQSYTIKYEPIGDTIVAGEVRYSNSNNQIVEESFYQEVTIQTGNSVSNIEVRFQATLTGSAVRGTIS